MMVESERDKYVNKEIHETTKTDAETSSQVNCGGNDRNVAEVKAASVNDEQMQWTNGEPGKDCVSKDSPADGIQKMDISPEKDVNHECCNPRCVGHDAVQRQTL